MNNKFNLIVWKWEIAIPALAMTKKKLRPLKFKSTPSKLAKSNFTITEMPLESPKQPL